MRRNTLNGIIIIDSEEFKDSRGSFSENFNLKKFQNYMLAKGVDVRNFFPPLSTLPMFKKKESFKNSKKLFANSFNIPSHISLTKAEQNKIINLINNYFERL